MAIKTKSAPADVHNSLMPHKVYHLPLAAIAQKQDLDGLPLTSWRYLFPHEDGGHRAVEVKVIDSGNHMFQSPHEAQHVDSFLSVYKALHKHDLVKRYDYEINLLRVPDCDVVAIWLKGDSHDHEMMIPLAPAHPIFEAGEMYSVRRFMDIVESIARERSMQETPRIYDQATEDDLVRIEGIGPHIAALLKSNGISTFAQLASNTPDQLRAILKDSGKYNRSDPTTWAEQAALAAAGKWQDLENLQQQLKGGRK